MQKTVSIPEYYEERAIVELDIYPIQFAENAMVLRDKLVRRGQHFATYREFKHKRYTGLTLGDFPEEVGNTTLRDIDMTANTH